MSEIEKVQVLIIGSGCAGNTAAIYAARASMNPIILEGEEVGGQISLTSSVENFPGFPEGIGGYDLVDNMKKQAKRFGAKYMMETVSDIDLSERPFRVTTKSGKQFSAATVIIATGARARLLGVPGEKDLFGHGVSSCATCDGAFYRDKKVVVMGGGDTAMEDALFLTRFAKEVHVLHRRKTFRASKIMQDKVLAHEKITVHWNTEIIEIFGQDKKVTAIKTVSHPEGKPVEKIKAGGSPEKAGVKVEDFPCDGVFLAIGHIPNNEFLKGQLPLNSEGYILPKVNEEEPTNDVETKVPGVFVAGDVADWKFQQAITASAMGCKAAMAAEAFMTEHGE